MSTQDLKDIATRLRIHSINATNASKSGHPTSCSSIAEILSVLFFDIMRYDPKHPENPSSDRFVLSKGHAAPVLYAAWAEAGYIPVSELTNLRKLDSDLEGHPTPRLKFVDIATGSLGQGLSVSAGMAYTGKYFDKADLRIYCVIGDGELAEGSNWEALSFASHYKLNNLCAIFDINRLGQSEPTAFQHNLDVYESRIKAFGWEVFVVDGHDVNVLQQAFTKASQVKDRPQAIIAKTFKGKDFFEIEDKDNWHGKPLGDKAENILKQLQAKIMSPQTKYVPKPTNNLVPNVNLKNIHLASPPNYNLGDKVATRQAYGTALEKLGRVNDRVIALDGDTKNSTFSDTYRKNFPSRYIECFIAEQNLVGVAIGVGCKQRCIPFVSTFACFLTRAFDQIRMAAVSNANLKLVGSHCGVSIGEDGPSQMALEDIAMFRTIPGCTVFYPSDAVSVERACELAAQEHGIAFIRTSRPATSVIYKNDEEFQVGKAKIVLSHDEADICLIVGAGVTLHEALKAAGILETEGKFVRVMDPFTIKPIDKEALINHAVKCKGKVLVVEDHYPEGGIGECIAKALKERPDVIVKTLAVQEVPRSGPPQALIEKYGIDAKSIANAVKSFEF